MTLWKYLIPNPLPIAFLATPFEGSSLTILDDISKGPSGDSIMTRTRGRDYPSPPPVPKHPRYGPKHPKPLPIPPSPPLHPHLVFIHLSYVSPSTTPAIVSAFHMKPWEEKHV
jgi:hypothetical protein